jgi:hypothetical protein
MAKHAKKENRQPKKEELQTSQLAERYAGVLQVLALGAVVGLLVLRAFVNTLDVPSYVIIGLLGLAVGLSPEQISKMLTDVIKAFIGKK